MTINALNSGAKVWLADHEDANTPLWDNVVAGPAQPAATRSPARSTSPRRRARTTSCRDLSTTIVVRPRGWHLPEKHILVDGEQTSGSLVDFALYFFHNGQALLDAGKGPYFYLPKMESHLEARLWNDVFLAAQELLGLPARHDPGDGAHRDASRPRSRWTRSSTSCASTRPGSTPAAGTTCSR